MVTALLLDHQDIFRAIEGSLLRRERCRLVMAGAVHLLATARACRPDLILSIAIDDESRAAAIELCRARGLMGIPVILLTGGGSDAVRIFSGDLARSAKERGGRVDVLALKSSGRLARESLDARLDEALKEAIPLLNRGSDRIPADLPVRCEGRGFTTTLRTKNLSPSGLFLKTARPMAPGRRFRVKFRLPQPFVSDAGVLASGDDLLDPTVTALCEVARKIPATRGPRKATRVEAAEEGLQAGWPEGDLIPGVGVRFVEMDERGRATLDGFFNRGGTARVARPRRPAREGRRGSVT